MATGRSHGIITISLAAPITAYLTARYFPLELVFVSVLSCILGGLYLSPDKLAKAPIVAVPAMDAEA